MRRRDTIAAIATPFGLSGIGMIRISGPDALAAARRLFRPSGGSCAWQSHHLYHGDILSTDGLTVLDEVLIAFMQSPRSFTGEDVVEINCHGNPLIIQSIMTQLQALGCRPARPGEFSERAFLNNRLDLSQAEALSSMICAQSEKAVAIGLAQLKGSLSGEIDALRRFLIDALAQLEAILDFAEDTERENGLTEPPPIRQALEKVQDLLASYHAGRAYTEGITVIITGKPNVGKSSLLNALAGRKKAIVTDIPGTTRDLITDTLHLNGIPVHLIDTAGIRDPQNAIEREGIALVWESLEKADMAIVMLDVSGELTDEDRILIEKNRSGKILVAINKIDLPHAWEKELIKKLFPQNTTILDISAKTRTGLDDLKKAILDLSVGPVDDQDGVMMITNLRHKSALEKARANIQNAMDSISRGLSVEFAAFDLKEAVDHLDEITGKKIDDEILDKIFSSFCIGK